MSVGLMGLLACVQTLPFYLTVKFSCLLAENINKIPEFPQRLMTNSRGGSWCLIGESVLNQGKAQINVRNSFSWLCRR